MLLYSYFCLNFPSAFILVFEYLYLKSQFVPPFSHSYPGQPGPFTMLFLFQGNVNSMNTLGWYAMDVEKNMTKAASYFEVACKFNDPDAAHNLGHMYLSGIYPDQKASKVWNYVIVIIILLKNYQLFIVYIY